MSDATEVEDQKDHNYSCLLIHTSDVALDTSLHISSSIQSHLSPISSNHPRSLFRACYRQPLQNLLLSINDCPILDRIPMRPRNKRISRQVPILKSAPTTHHQLYTSITYTSRNGSTSAAPGVFLQSRIKSIAIPNIPIRCTPACSMRRFASAASLSSKVPLASVLAHTS